VVPWRTLGSATAPGGGTLVLQERAGEFAIRIDGYVLMSSRAHGSEEALAEGACARLAGRAAPRVLIGGLGLGFTVRAALDRLPAGASVTVAEVVPAVVDWNRGPLADLAARPLDDPRVTVATADVGAVLAAAPPATFDAVLLDVDNGPTALPRPANADLYDARGIAVARASLRPGGVLGVWSAAPDDAFAARLRRGGFSVRVERIRSRGRVGTRHVLFLAVR
jgi:spermidine synthase